MTDQSLHPVASIQTGPEQDRTIFPFKATRVVWLLIGLLELLIALRIGLLLFGASSISAIVSMIYSFTGLFLVPFAGLITSPSTGSMVLELSSIFAMLIYALVAWVIERMIWGFFYHPGKPVLSSTKTTLSEHQPLH